MAMVIPWIGEILEADQKAPQKQRHAAHRICCRLPEAAVGVDGTGIYLEANNRIGIEARRSVRSPNVSLRPGWTSDWHEACAEIDGEQVKAYIFF